MSQTQPASPAPARVLWFEIVGRDHQSLQRFYGELFGWQLLHDDAMPTYAMFTGEGGQPVGGVGAVPGDASWTTFYVQVDDLDAALARAQGLGARVLMPPVEQGPNRYCVVADLEGHPIGLVQHAAAAGSTLPA